MTSSRTEDARFLEEVCARHTPRFVQLRHMRPGDEYTVCDLCRQFWPCDAIRLASRDMAEEGA